MLFNLCRSPDSSSLLKGSDVVKGDWKSNFWGTRARVRVQIGGIGELYKQTVVQGIFSRIISSILSLIGFRSCKHLGKKITSQKVEFTAADKLDFMGWTTEKKAQLHQRQHEKIDLNFISLREKIGDLQAHFIALRERFAEGTPAEELRALNEEISDLLNQVVIPVSELEQKYEFLVALEVKFKELLERGKEREIFWHTVPIEPSSNTVKGSQEEPQINQVSQASEGSRQEALRKEYTVAQARLAAHLEFLKEKESQMAAGSESEQEIRQLITEHQRTLLEEIPERLNQGFVDGFRQFVWNAIQQDMQRLKELDANYQTPSSIQDSQVEDMTLSGAYGALADPAEVANTFQEMQKMHGEWILSIENAQHLAGQLGFSAIEKESGILIDVFQSEWKKFESIAEAPTDLNVVQLAAFQLSNVKEHSAERLEEMMEIIRLSLSLKQYAGNLLFLFSEKAYEDKLHFIQLAQFETDELVSQADLSALKQREKEMMALCQKSAKKLFKTNHQLFSLSIRQLAAKNALPVGLAEYLIFQTEADRRRILNKNDSLVDMESFYTWLIELREHSFQENALLELLSEQETLSIESLLMREGNKIGQMGAAFIPESSEEAVLLKEFDWLKEGKISLVQTKELLDKTHSFIDERFQAGEISQVEHHQWLMTYPVLQAKCRSFSLLLDFKSQKTAHLISELENEIQSLKDSGSSDMLVEKFSHFLNKIKSAHRHALEEISFSKLELFNKKQEQLHEKIEGHLSGMRKVDKAEKAYRKAFREADQKLHSLEQIKGLEAANPPQYVNILALQKLMNAQVDTLRELGTEYRTPEQMREYRHALVEAKKNLENAVDLCREMSVLEQIEQLESLPHALALREQFISSLHQVLKEHLQSLNDIKNALVKVWKDTPAVTWHSEVFSSISKSQAEAARLLEGFTTKQGFILSREKTYALSEVTTPDLLKKYAAAVKSLIIKQRQVLENETNLNDLMEAEKLYLQSKASLEQLHPILEDKKQFVHLKNLQPFLTVSFENNAHLNSLENMKNHALDMRTFSQQVELALEAVRKGYLSEREQLKDKSLDPSEYKILHKITRNKIREKIKAYQNTLSQYEMRLKNYETQMHQEIELLKLEEGKEQEIETRKKTIDAADKIYSRLLESGQNVEKMRKHFPLKGPFPWSSRELKKVSQMSADELTTYENEIAGCLERELDEIHQYAEEHGLKLREC